MHQYAEFGDAVNMVVLNRDVIDATQTRQAADAHNCQRTAYANQFVARLQLAGGNPFFSVGAVELVESRGPERLALFCPK